MRKLIMPDFSLDTSRDDKHLMVTNVRKMMNDMDQSLVTARSSLGDNSSSAPAFAPYHEVLKKVKAERRHDLLNNTIDHIKPNLANSGSVRRPHAHWQQYQTQERLITKPPSELPQYNTSHNEKARLARLSLQLVKDNKPLNDQHAI